MKEHMRGIWWMLAFTLIDAFGLNVGRVLGDKIHVYQFLCVGNALAAIMLGIFMWKAGHLVKSNTPKLHIARAVAETFGQGLMFSSLMLVPVAEVKSILFLIPIIASINAVYFLGEKNTPHKWFALFFGFVGVLIILQPDKDIIHFGSLLALAATLFLSTGLTIIKKTTDVDSPMTVSLYFTTLISICTLPAAIYFWQPIAPEMYKWLFAFGLIIVAAHITISSACKHAPLVVVTPFMFIGLIFVAILAYLLHGQVPTVNVFIGGAVIIGAATYTAHRESKRKA